MDLEKKIVQELSGDEAFRHTKKITKEIPTRMAGTEECKRMAEYLRDQMIGYGIPAEVNEFDALVGFTGTAELMVVEPEVIDFPPFEDDDTENIDEEQERIKKEKKKKTKDRRRRIRRLILFFIILALLAFVGIQVYSWASGFITDVVQPIIAQNVPEQSQPQPQAQVVPTSTTRSIAPTSAPVQQAVVPTSTSQPTTPSQPKTLFSDNFDTGLSSGWQVAYGNPLVVNGLLTTDSDTMLIVGDSSWRDYAVEYDASAGFCWLTKAENWVSVRAMDTDNNYAYKWAFCESFWYIVKNGKWSEVPQSGFNPGSEEHHFKIQAEGGSLAVYVDGMLMSSLYDTSFNQGKVNLRISENTTIDNFVIKELE